MKKSVRVLIIGLIILGIGIIAYQLLQNYSQENSSHQQENSFSKDLEKSTDKLQNTSTPSDKKPQKNIPQSQHAPGCVGRGAINFTSPPRRLEEIDNIQPLGLMIGGHVTPIDHQYWNQPGWLPPDQLTAKDLRDVLAPASGRVTLIQRMPSEYSTIKDSSLGDYRIIIHHTCTFYTIYIHIYQLSPKLQEALKSFESNRPNSEVSVEAGEIIGRASGFDFSAHNDEIILPGFLVPKSYGGESWKIHTVDPFDYFQEPLKSQLTSKVLRTASPLGGKIDYDIDGKLMGNWFEENTGGYSGFSQGAYNYWKTHLAFAPQGNDPSEIIASLGDFKGEAMQFGVKGNSPDPAQIGIESGMIKYELVTFDFYTQEGKPWNHQGYEKGGLKIKNRDEDVRGVLLVQLIDKRKLKAEVFPGKTIAQVSAFTDNARIYER